MSAAAPSSCSRREIAVPRGRTPSVYERANLGGGRGEERKPTPGSGPGLVAIKAIAAVVLLAFAGAWDGFVTEVRLPLPTSRPRRPPGGRGTLAPTPPGGLNTPLV